MRRFNLKITAVLFLLLLIQNVGLRLWLHDALHESNFSKQATANTTHLTTACSCLDEFFTPIFPAEHIEVEKPEKLIQSVSNIYAEYFTSVQKDFHSLRGPPQIA